MENMARKSASLLTKTQRRRLRDEFDGLDEEKTRRDQQRIRERLRSGVLDYRLLADYPDRQFELAFDDVSEEELEAALVDAALVVERLRELQGYDRDEHVKRVRERASELAAAADEASTLDRIDPKPADEVRREAKEEVRERLGTTRWEKRADGLMKIGASALVGLVALGASDAYLGTQLFANNLHTPLLFVLVLLGIGGWSLIRGVRAVKHDVVPTTLRLLKDPKGTVRDAWEGL